MKPNSLLRSSVICLILAIATLAFAGLTEKQVYRKCRAALRKSHGYQVEVWKLDEKGANPQFVESVLFDAKRGFIEKDRTGITSIGNANRVWTKNAAGGGKVSKRSYGDAPDYRELYVGKDKPGPTSFGTTAIILTFDGRRCYQLNPMYGDLIMTSVVLYIDAKTFLLAGYSESFQGNWSDTYAFRKLKLNPHTNANTFSFQK